MLRLPSFSSSRPPLYRYHQPKSPEIVNRFGNNERALRRAESELVGITPVTAPFLAKRFFTGGGVCEIGFVVPDAAPLNDCFITTRQNTIFYAIAQRPLFPPLRCAFCLPVSFPVFDISRLEPFSDKAQYPFVADSYADEGHQFVVRDAVEEFLQVRI